jgi:hypothetical protein
VDHARRASPGCVDRSSREIDCRAMIGDGLVTIHHPRITGTLAGSP